MTTIYWCRNDLRLADNPALLAACKANTLQIVYIDDTVHLKRGGASRWWLTQSLQQFEQCLFPLNQRICYFRGDPLEILPRIAAETQCDTVVWNRVYEPAATQRDTTLKNTLKQQGVSVQTFNGHLWVEPWENLKADGTQFKVFTPFWKQLQTKPCRRPLAAPQTLPPMPILNTVCSLPSYTPHWAAGMATAWTVGEQAAYTRFNDFLANALEGYKENRNIPAGITTSRLSPHLHFGEISVPQIVHALGDLDTKDKHHFASELAWREFSYHLLYYFPELPTKNWKPAFDAYPWQENVDALSAWKRGQTGYPIVDAGMRELWHTGWMHNRVRMITASFLIKHLRQDWRLGEQWFWDTLVDADMANNAASWQWVAGSGADASPYFRIFNPVLQGQKFDERGEYVRKWVPELGNLNDAYLHAPWQAPAPVLAAAGITLGKNYPKPIVDHDKARVLALEGYQLVQGHTLS